MQKISHNIQQRSNSHILSDEKHKIQIGHLKFHHLTFDNHVSILKELFSLNIELSHESKLENTELNSYTQNGSYFMLRDAVIPYNTITNRYEAIINLKKQLLNDYILNNHLKSLLEVYNPITNIFEWSILNSIKNSVLRKFKHYKNEIVRFKENMTIGVAFKIEDYYFIKLKTIVINALGIVFQSSSEIKEISTSYIQLLQEYEDYFKNPSHISKTLQSKHKFFPKGIDSNAINLLVNDVFQQNFNRHTILKTALIKFSLTREIDSNIISTIESEIISITNSNSFFIHKITIQLSNFNSAIRANLTTKRTKKLNQECVYHLQLKHQLSN